ARRSPPALNPRSPTAASTTRVTARSSAHCWSCCVNARTMSSVTALSALGRLSVTMPAVPRRSNRISGSDIRPLGLPCNASQLARGAPGCNASEPIGFTGVVLRQKIFITRAIGKVDEKFFKGDEQTALTQRFWRTAKGFWSGEARRIAWILTFGLLLVSLAQVFIQYRINVWNREIFDAIEKKDAGIVLTQALIFIPLALAGVGLA